LETLVSALPDGFSELERFVDKWDLPGTNERYAERLRSEFTDLEDFHAAVRARFDAIQSHLDARPLVDYSAEDRRLARLVWAWVLVAEAVEVFKQSRVPDSKNFWRVSIEPEV
jgi:hypothetical protein